MTDRPLPRGTVCRPPSPRADNGAGDRPEVRARPSFSPRRVDGMRATPAYVSTHHVPLARARMGRDMNGKICAGVRLFTGRVGERAVIDGRAESGFVSLTQRGGGGGWMDRLRTRSSCPTRRSFLPR